jgi:hypothetical protein
VTLITLAAKTTAQYIRIVNGEGNGQWWSIHELRVPCAGSVLPTRPRKSELATMHFRIGARAEERSILVDYEIPEKGWVTIERFSPDGSRLGVLVDGFQNSGNHAVACRTGRLGSGTVIFKISFKGSSQVKRVVLVK